MCYIALTYVLRPTFNCVGIMALKLTTPRHWSAIIVELDIKLSLRQL